MSLVCTREFELEVVRRMEECTNVCALADEPGIQRMQLDTSGKPRRMSRLARDRRFGRREPV